ncbi:hypothetical protein BGP_1290 [Beggiatoa sp. PS]|nr:hypothetical protein BGP_1290 [Beggiatoa sp. PS]
MVARRKILNLMAVERRVGRSIANPFFKRLVGFAIALQAPYNFFIYFNCLVGFAIALPTLRLLITDTGIKS